MVRSLPLLLALMVLGGCLSARRTADVRRYRSVDAAFAAHPELRTQGLVLVDGVIFDAAGADTVAAREVASIDVIGMPQCGNLGVVPSRCPVMEVTTRSGLRIRAQTRRQMGSLRIRVRDEATGRFIAAEYRVVDDSGSESPITSGADGWGRAEALRPGRYRLQLYEYPCGDSLYLSDEAWAVRESEEVLVPPRRRTDLDLRVDVRAIQADTAWHPARCEINGEG